MTSIALFALIGAKINAGIAYWIIFAIYCTGRAIEIAGNIIEERQERKHNHENN